GSWLAGCANTVLPELGDDPDDAAALVRHLGRDDRGMDFGIANIAYGRILATIEALGHDGASPADRTARTRIDAARGVLRRGLADRDRWPNVAAPNHPNYAPHFVAMHLAAKAGLGDAAAQRSLYALIDDANDTTRTAWLAALWALRLGLPAAADH